jgi:O-antigen/teichoic acid export membrane protein
VGSDLSFVDDGTPVGDQALSVTLPAPAVRAGFASAPSKSLAKRAIHGSVWTFAGYGSSQLMRFGANIILTRLLFPRAFGQMALINVLMQGLQMFSDLGIGPAIIKHNRTHDPEFFNTAWTMQVIRGVVLWLVACAMAAPVAMFYQTPMLTTMIPVAALTALIAVFSSTKLYIEGRELRLARLVGIELLTQIVSIFVMILLAKYWGSVWALVLGGLVGTLLKTLLSHIALPGMTNRFCWDRPSAHKLYHFGRWIFVSTLFTFLAMQSDRLLLGRLIPLEMLGVYSIALGMVSIGIGVFEQFTNRILMPAMAHFRRESRHRFNDVVLKSRNLILSAAAVAVANVILMAPTLFDWLYDARYHEAGRISQWLGFGLWFTLLQRTSQASLLAAGRSKALALANAVNCFVTIVAAPLGFHLWGLEGFIGGWTLGNLAAVLIVDTALARDGIELRWQDAVLTAGLLTFVMVGFSMHHVLRENFAWNQPHWLIELLPPALLSIAAGVVIYLDYRKSEFAYSRILSRELGGMAAPMPDDASGILSNDPVSGLNGRTFE